MRIFQLEDKKEEVDRFMLVTKNIPGFLERYIQVYDYESAIKLIIGYDSDFDIYIIDGEFPYKYKEGENNIEFLCIDFYKELRKAKKSPNIIIYSGYGEASKNRKRIKEYDPHLPFFSKNELEEMIEYINRFKHELMIPRN